MGIFNYLLTQKPLMDQRQAKLDEADALQETQAQFHAGLQGQDLSQMGLSDVMDLVREQESIGLSGGVLQDHMDYLQGETSEVAAFDRGAAGRQQAVQAALLAREREDAQRKEVRLGQLQDDVRGDVTQGLEMASAFRGAMTAPEGFAGDSIVVNAFARMLNPTGVLTDDDIGRVAGDPSIPAMIKRGLNKYLQGEPLSKEERDQLMRGMAGQYKENRAGMERLLSPTLRTAGRFGMDPLEIVPEGMYVTDEELAPLTQQATPLGAMDAPGKVHRVTGWDEGGNPIIEWDK